MDRSIIKRGKAVQLVTRLVTWYPSQVPTEAESRTLFPSSERIQSPPTPGSCRFPYSRSGRISFVSIAMLHCSSAARRRSLVRRLDDTDGGTWCGVRTFGVDNGNTHCRRTADLIAGL